MEVSMFERKDYISWDEAFMALAKVIAMRSKDPTRQVGAVIVDKDNHILSLGYNGAPKGFNDENFPWNKEGDPLKTKYMYVCHAEMNAISNFNGNKERLQGSKLYVTLFPCNECAKLIIQNGIKNIIYESDRHAKQDSTIASKKMLDYADVKYQEYHLNKDILIEKYINNQGAGDGKMTSSEINKFDYNSYRVVNYEMLNCLENLKQAIHGYYLLNSDEYQELLECLNDIIKLTIGRHGEIEFELLFRYISTIEYLIKIKFNEDTQEMINTCLCDAQLIIAKEINNYEKANKIKPYGFKLVNDHKSK
jgi:dCMP deaminase